MSFPNPGSETWPQEVYLSSIERLVEYDFPEEDPQVFVKCEMLGFNSFTWKIVSVPIPTPYVYDLYNNWGIGDLARPTTYVWPDFCPGWLCGAPPDRRGWGADYPDNGAEYLANCWPHLDDAQVYTKNGFIKNLITVVISYKGFRKTYTQIEVDELNIEATRTGSSNVGGSGSWAGPAMTANYGVKITHSKYLGCRTDKNGSLSPLNPPYQLSASMLVTYEGSFSGNDPASLGTVTIPTVKVRTINEFKQAVNDYLAGMGGIPQ